jgi:hypothetical protein
MATVPGKAYVVAGVEELAGDGQAILTDLRRCYGWPQNVERHALVSFGIPGRASDPAFGSDRQERCRIEEAVAGQGPHGRELRSGGGYPNSNQNSVASLDAKDRTRG